VPYDVKRELKPLYAPKNREWRVLEVPSQQFLAVDGVGDPNTSEDYTRAVEALYAVAYTLKFASKHRGQDFVVGPLEGLWWSPNPEVFTTRAKESWHWRMLISQPHWISTTDIKEATETALAKKKLPTIADVGHETLHEGLSAQALHIGSYDDETPLMATLHNEFLPANALTPSGHHHEIYLSDPRKTAAEKLRTVIRQPCLQN
jgi:hypothetical protein